MLMFRSTHQRIVRDLTLAQVREIDTLRVLVCGGRHFGRVPVHIRKWSPEFEARAKQAREERALLDRTLDEFARANPVALLIEGGEQGADRLARFWAERNGIRIKTCEAEWDALGKAAGPIRNKRMLDEGRPDMVIAFPGGKGTLNMISQAARAGVPVMEVGGGTES